MPHKVLKEVFGFDSFRAGQEEIIQAVLSGKDTLGVLPTGGGKSLCYQIPALMLDSLTVIVSPLISLMKDQVDSLLQSEVAGAAALHSGLTPEERWDVERRVRSGEIKMLLVAPERLRSMEFVLSLRGAPSGVGLFVVDEAHCISEWGHDFRPDYLFLPKAIRDLGSPPVLALTATANPQVRRDVFAGARDARSRGGRDRLQSPEPHVQSYAGEKEGREVAAGVGDSAVFRRIRDRVLFYAQGVRGARGGATAVPGSTRSTITLVWMMRGARRYRRGL